MPIIIFEQGHLSEKRNLAEHCSCCFRSFRMKNPVIPISEEKVNSEIVESLEAGCRGWLVTVLVFTS